MLAPGSKNESHLKLALASNIASSLENLSPHLSSSCLRSSVVGLLLEDRFLLADGLGDSLRFVFLVGVDCTALTFSTLPSTLTCAGSTRVGVDQVVELEVVFLSFLSL